MTALTIVNKKTSNSMLVSGEVKLSAASVVMIDLRPEQIKGMERQGNDLKISLVSGEVIVIQDFFQQFDGLESSLVLGAEGSNDYWLASFSSGQGELVVGYAPIDSIEPLLVHENSAFPFAALLLGGGALAGVVSDSASDGNDANPQVPAPFDGLKPPTVNLTTTDNGRLTVSGVADPGVQVVVQFPDGSTQTVTSGADGSYAATSQAPQGNGEAIVYSTDAQGNNSAETSQYYSKPPTINVIPNDDGTIRVEGETEPGAEVHVTFPDGKTETVTADADGKYSVESETPQTDGDVVVNYTDGSGNTSPDYTESYTDNTPPKAPSAQLSVNPDGSVNVSGEAEAGSTVHVQFPDGKTQEVTAGADGKYSVNSDGRQPSGEVEVYATDKAGNDGPSTKLQFDANSPSITITAVTGDGLINLAESTDVTISGTSTVGEGRTVTVTVTDTQGSVVTGTAVVQANGSWKLEDLDLSSLQDGALVIQAQATDIVGNPAVERQVVQLDTTVPDAPTVNFNTNADSSLTVSGEAEAGSEVTVTFPDNSVNTVTAGSDGRYSVTSDRPQGNGEVSAHATDKAGNQSSDTQEPYLKPPVFEMSENNDGTIRVEGEAEPGSEVHVVFPNGEKETVIAGQDGSFSVDSTSPQTNGDVSVDYTDGDGNDSPKTTLPYEDTQPPLVPTINPNPPVANQDGMLVVSGRAEAGSNVTVTFPDGTKKTIEAGADSRYSVTSDAEQPYGDVVAYAVDKAGNQSGDATVLYLPAPVFVVESDSGGNAQVEGMAAPGAQVHITFPDGQTETVTAQSDGKFSVTSQNPQGTGNVVVKYTDTKGNKSPSSTELFTDTTKPEAPTMELSVNADGTLTVSGEAEAGTEVSVTFPDGTTKTAQVGGDGQYSVKSDVVQDTGEVRVNAKDKANNISDSAADWYLKAPDFTASSDSSSKGIVLVTGNAAPGAVVHITFPDDEKKTVTAGADGGFSVSSTLPQSNGDIVVDYDYQGKTSPSTTESYVDSIPPQAPTINTALNADGTLKVSGDAEADSMVHVTFPDGSKTTVRANPQGKYEVNSETRQESGEVKALAVDRAGNRSKEATAQFEVNGPDVTGIDLMIEPITGDDTINIAESKEPTTTISGTVTGPWNTAAESAVVSFTLDGTRYSAKVKEDGTWSTDVNTDDLLSITSIPEGGGAREGQFAATVELTDSKGYSSKVPKDHTYTVDLDVQYITITAVTGDGLINKAESTDFSISGTTTVEVGRPVTVVITDSSGDPAKRVEATATVNSDQTWRIDNVDVSGLSDGTLQLEVSTLSEAGNPASTSRDATLDTVLPDIADVKLTVGAIADDDVINQSESELPSMTISGTLEDVPDDVVEKLVRVTLNGTVYNAKLQPDGSWSVEVPTQELLDATVTKVFVGAVLTDAAGNSAVVDKERGYSVQLTTTDTITMEIGGDFIDSLPPESVEPDATVRETLSTDRYTSDTTFTLAPIFTAGVLSATYQYSFNGGEWMTLDTAAGPAGYAVNLGSGGVARGDGEYSFRAIGVDRAGNTVESDRVSVTIDTKAPVGTQIYAAGSKLVTGVAEAGSWIALDYSFNGAGVDAYVRTSETAAADGKYYWTYEAATEMAVSGTVVAIAFDKAGNASAPSTALGIDASAPTLTLDATDGTTIGGTVGDLDNPYPSASETAPITVTVYITEPGKAETVHTVRVTADGPWHLDLPEPLPMGTTVKAVAKDAAGNASPMLSVGVGGEVSQVEGVTNWGLLGWDVRNAGDFNGDGFEDFVMVAPHASHSSPQNNANLWEAYLIYGSAAGLPTQIDLSQLKGTEGIKIYTSASIADANVLAHVNGYGDINGDGYDDLVLSDDNVDSGYVIMGRATPTSEASVSIDVKQFQKPNGGANEHGFGLFRDGGPAWVGLSATIADVNNDGYADIAITTDRSNAGVHIIYGHAGAAGSEAWQNYGIGNNVVTDYNGQVSTRPFNSIETGSSANFGVTGLGDVNGDGFQDFAWGSQGNNTVTVMYGGVGLNSDGTFSNIPQYSGYTNSLISFYTTNSAGRGFRLTNVELERVGDDALNSRSTLTHPIASGDFNGDGIADIVVGAGAAGGTAGYAGQGTVYVIFGKEGGLTGDIDARNLAANGAGFSISSPTYSTSNRRYDSFGRSVTMGDFNGDGIDDIALGAPLADNGGNNNGSVFIIYGKAGTPDTFSDITAGISGPAGAAGSMERIDGTQSSTSTANNTGNNASTFGSTLGAGVTFGDFNGDGIADLGIGSPYQDGDQPRGGHIDVLYGKPENMTQLYTAGDDVLAGTAGVDRLSGGAGNDTITNIGSGDVAYGGQGDDLIAITSSDFVRVDGNEGMNTLRIDSASSLTLDFSKLGMKVQNFSVIDLGVDGSGVNGDHTVALRLSDVMSLTQGQTRTGFQPLRIHGDDEDTVILRGSDSYVKSSTRTEGGVEYDVYSHTPATPDIWSTTSFTDIWVQQGVVVQNVV